MPSPSFAQRNPHCLATVVRLLRRRCCTSSTPPQHLSLENSRCTTVEPHSNPHLFFSSTTFFSRCDPQIKDPSFIFEPFPAISRFTILLQMENSDGCPPLLVEGDVLLSMRAAEQMDKMILARLLLVSVGLCLLKNGVLFVVSPLAWKFDIVGAGFQHYALYGHLLSSIGVDVHHGCSGSVHF